MNFLVGKIGQKLIFNRNSNEAKRSNTNGNFGAYKLFQLLFEQNKNDTFFVIGDNDLIPNQFENVYNAYDLSINILKNIKQTFGIFIPSILNDKRVINIINTLKFPYIILADDPRCLDELNKNNLLKHLPTLIISQFEDSYIFKNVLYNVKYIPIERAIIYNNYIQNNINLKSKTITTSVIANITNEYHRLEIVDELTKNQLDVNIYGRLDINKIYRKQFKGEINYLKIIKIMSQSLSTLLVPIKPGWVTSKYVEALMNNTLPIFYKDYNTLLLGSFSNLIINNTNDFDKLYNILKNDTSKKEIKKLINNLKELLITAYVDGSKLNNELMRCIYDCNK